MTAEEAVRVLLSFYADALPGPRAQSLGALPGVAPSRKVACEDCHGKGERRVRSWSAGDVRRDDDGALWAICQRCDGRAWLVVDDYTGSEVGSEETAPRVVRRSVTCDGCGGQGAHGNGRRCRHCDGAGTVSVSAEAAPERQRSRPDEDELAVALRAGRASGASRLWAAGSFAAVGQALSELAPAMKMRAWRAYVSQETDPEPDLLAIIAARVRHLERGQIRVPGELRRWAEERQAARPSYRSVGERNEAIRAMRAEGATLRRIAGEFGVSRSQVERICR